MMSSLVKIPAIQEVENLILYMYSHFIALINTSSLVKH